MSRAGERQLGTYRVDGALVTVATPRLATYGKQTQAWQFNWRSNPQLDINGAAEALAVLNALTRTWAWA